VRYAFEVKGDRAAVRRIDELATAAGNPKPVLVAAGEIIRKGLERQFETEGRHLGDPWPALAAETLERKSRQSQSPDLMVATGALKASLSGGSGSVMRVAKWQVRVGTKDFVARFKQGGAKGARRGVEPARKLVGIAARDRAEIFTLLRRHMVGAPGV
jgi:phage gpG-like protein